MEDYTNETKKISGKKVLKKIINRIVHPNIISLIVVAVIVGGLFFFIGKISNSEVEPEHKEVVTQLSLKDIGTLSTQEAYVTVVEAMDEFKLLLLQLIKDIELQSKKIGCYAYPKTIRSILTASEKSKIAQHFKGKKYYGYVDHKMSLTKLSAMLDELVEEGYLTTILHNDKKRYVSKDEELPTSEEIDETDFDLIDYLFSED